MISLPRSWAVFDSGSVDGGTEVPWCGPDAVLVDADVEIGLTISARPLRLEDEMAAIASDAGCAFELWAVDGGALRACADPCEKDPPDDR